MANGGLQGFGAALLLAVIAAAPLPASAARPAPDRSATVREIERRISETYVVPELRPKIVARLEQGLLANRYDAADASLFVTRVNEDLDAVAHDGHLYLADDVDQYRAMLAPPRADDGLEAYRRAEAVRDHSGLTRLDILPGNIRYLKLEHFQWIPGVTAGEYDAAARFLAGGDAVIIDLRNNGGGESDAGDYFAKVFLAPDPLRLDTAQARERNRAWTGKPLYLLVDAGVGSAAEAVAYGAQQEKVAVVVGANTYGAANNNRKFAIAPEFVLSVSYNRPVNPISGTNWEGVGVRPDITVSADKALEAAELAALQTLGARTGVPADRLAEYRWARTAIEARRTPVVISPERLRSLAGQFGTIELKADDAGLHFYRSDRPKRPQGVVMTSLDDQGLFAIDGYDDLRARVGAGEVVLMHGAEDAREVFPRTQAAASAGRP